MKFRSDLIAGLLNNEGDFIGQLVRRIAPTEKIVVAIGLGAKETGVPLRFLAYLAPLMRLREQLPPQTVVEVYVALEGCLRANNVSQPKRVRENAALMTRLIEHYTREVYPDRQVKVLFDEPVTPAVEEWIAQTVQTLWPKAPTEVKNFCEKRGGATAFHYMVEHSLYMRDPIIGVDSSMRLVPAMERDFGHVLMVGGPSEKIFYRVRQQVLQTCGRHDGWQSHQLFTPVGDPPTYHPQAGEPLWEQRQELPEDVCQLLPKAVVDVAREHATRVGKDLLVLLADLGGCRDFNRLNSESRACLRGETPSDLQLILQAGWDRLRSFPNF